uniref:Uncharacterized protein n=1 Tax=Oscillatoriales cyanobacterium SpSt-402 TaxID=2282168 RepID=A0A832H2M3_9CYAN
MLGNYPSQRYEQSRFGKDFPVSAKTDRAWIPGSPGYRQIVTAKPLLMAVGDRQSSYPLHGKRF